MKTIIKKLLPREINWLQSRRKYWLDYWRDGEWELRELAKFVPREKLAVDVGGNIGVYTYHLSRLAKTVVAFEPNPKYFARLAALNLKNVRLEQTALSSQAGTGNLRVPHVNGQPDEGMGSLEQTAVLDKNLHSSSRVSTRTLDSYQFLNVGFIKIDVEGHEESVLRGAQLTIERDLPSLLVEIEERHNPGGLKRIADHLGSLNYLGFFFQNGCRRDLQEFDASIHQRMPPDEALAHVQKSRRHLQYINNFLFLHSAATAPRGR